jgi:hypothetical protein
MSEDTKPEQPQVDPKQLEWIAAQAGAKTAELYTKAVKLYEQSTKDLTDTQLKAYDAVLRGIPRIDDKGIQRSVDDIFAEANKTWAELFTTKEETKTEDKKEESNIPPVKTSPSGQFTKSNTQVNKTEIVEEPDYKLADDEAYFDARERFFRATQTYKGNTRINPFLGFVK